MNIAIVGSRTFTDYQFFLKAMEEETDITHIVSGGAKGADYMAEMYAKEKKIPITVIKAEWDKYGKRAGNIRNEKIIQAVERVIAFWDGSSRGTGNAITLAKIYDKKVRIVDVPPIEVEVVDEFIYKPKT